MLARVDNHRAGQRGNLGAEILALPSFVPTPKFRDVLAKDQTMQREHALEVTLVRRDEFGGFQLRSLSAVRLRGGRIRQPTASVGLVGDSCALANVLAGPFDSGAVRTQHRLLVSERDSPMLVGWEDNDVAWTPEGP